MDTPTSHEDGEIYTITGENPRAFEQRVLGGNVAPFLSGSSLLESKTLAIF